MKPTQPHEHRCRKTIPLVLLATALASSAWGQSPVTIQNPGFEDPVLGDGASTSTIPGWTATASATILNPTTTHYPSGSPAEGANLASLFSGAANTGFSQILTSTLQADASYTLTVQIGDPLDATFDGYTIQLLANGTVLAQDDNTVTVTNGTFAAATATYTYNIADAALVGQPLEIRLLTKSLTNGDVNFDNVQLTVALGNPIANPGGPYSVALGGSVSLDGTGSLPSAGQTITLYEWDLNNDGLFNEAITGANPASISYADLQSVHSMSVGPNTINLRVTDDSSPTPKTSTIAGTVTIEAPIDCQLGVLDLSANGGINPNTGNPWQVGDQYRIAFHTLGTTQTTFNDPNYYNDFANTEAWAVPALQGTYWKAMVTVNLDPTTTQALSPKSLVQDNTGTGDLTGGFAQGGAGGPVYVVNGTTCIARNNADIWNSWSNPFEDLVSGAIVANPSGTGGNTIRVIINGVGGNNDPHYSPFLNQFGDQTVTPNAVHGKDIATGCNSNGGTNNPLGNTTDVTTINRGNSNANTTGRIWTRFGNNTTDSLSLYVMSVPLTIVDLSENVAPTLLSFVDDRSGTDAILGVDSVVYTVTFSEPIDAATLTIADFENLGNATVTIDSIRGTVDPTAFEVTVTPTSVGTLQLQAKAGTVIEDAVGNALNTTAPIADDTIITVVSDTTPPTLVSMEDNVMGGPIVAFNPVTYTVTFNEAIDASTIDIADFGNGGSASITVNSVAPTGNPAVYTVVVTPTGAGDLTLVIVAAATITDLSVNALDTTTPLPDDTTITVTPDPLPTLVSITDNQAGGPVFETQSFAYFVTLDQVINPSTVDVSDFENGTGPALTVNAVAATDNPSVFAVHVTPGGAGTITLQIAADAVITNVNGTAIDTTSALPDDTTITVNAGSGPARGTITVDGFASWNANASTLNGTLNAGGSDKLVVIVTGEHGNPGDLNGNSTAVTYDGVPLTKVVDRNPIGGTPIDQTFNDIWYLDNPGSAHTAGAISATVITRGSVTAFALSGTAPGVGQTAISPQASKSVVLSTGFANSIVIASHGMGGDGNTANVGSVDAVLPLTEVSALFNGSSWDGQVSAYALTTTPGTATYAFTGGNLVGSHTIAAEFLAAEVVTGSPYGTWANVNAPTGNPGDDFDGDGVSNAIEFVLGGLATTNDLDKLPAVATTGGDMTFTFVRDQNSVDPGVSTVIEVGTDLAAWPDVYTVGANTAGSSLGVTVTDNLNGTDTITLTVAQAPDAKKFARLKVVITP